MSSRLNEYLTNRGIRLLQPYPHMARTLLGSGLISLITAIILCTGYLSYQAFLVTIQFFQQKTPTIVVVEKKQNILPKPDVKAGQVYRESYFHTVLPYHEKATTPLTNRARQVDFALMQTIIRLNIAKDRIYPFITENRSHKKEIYHFQQIKLFLEDIEIFINMLQENLDVWAEKITLTIHNNNNNNNNNNIVYILSTGGIPTHELILVPINKSFISSPLTERPQLTIVIDDLGDNIDVANTLLSLNIPITLSILPLTKHATAIAIAAHEAGRETLIHQPMEAMQSPYVSAGPGEITLTMSPKKISTILYDNITKIPYASGMNNHMGSRFTCDEKSIRIVCDVLASQGLFVLDSLTHAQSSFYSTAKKRGLPAYCRTLFLDHGVYSETSILQNLKNAEKQAHNTGQAIVIGHPHPETIAALKKWLTLRDTSIHIVPLRYQKRSLETLDCDS